MNTLEFNAKPLNDYFQNETAKRPGALYSSFRKELIFVI